MKNQHKTKLIYVKFLKRKTKSASVEFIKRKNRMQKRVLQKLFFPLILPKKKNALLISNPPSVSQWQRRNFRISVHQKKTIYTQLKKQKRLRFLRHRLAPKMPDLDLKPWEELKLPPTKKEQWLTINYNKYQKLRIQDRIDFFRTYIGQILLSVEKHSQLDYKDSWFFENRLQWMIDGKWSWAKDLQNNYEQTRISREQRLFEITKLQKKTWWYENLIEKQIPSISERKFRLDRPNTAFQLHWKQQKKEPWKDSLLFKRALYEGFGERLRKENKFKPLKIKPYLRHKNPRREKRNRLYHRNNILLSNFRHRFRIRANKAARIKQIAGKILRPFYGDLRPKQMRSILKKSRTRKSKHVTSNEMVLSHLENRLDVVVYRLNLAPTILWARRLILNGSVFVQTQESSNFWNTMYSSIKKFAFPLKLRDPYHLYDKNLWKNSSDSADLNYWSKVKFFGQPKRKISYLVQPGDLIQCANGFFSNQFKTKSWLWRKPIPKHFMIYKKRKPIWHWRFQKYIYKTFNNWEKNSQLTTSAVMLYMPRFRDFNSTNRIQESFLRWAIL